MATFITIKSLNLYFKCLITCCFISMYSGVIGQSTLYLLKSRPAIFHSIEQALIAENFEESIRLGNEILSNNQASEIKGTALLYIGQAQNLSLPVKSPFATFDQALIHFQAAKHKEGIAYTYNKLADNYFFQDYHGGS